MFDFVVQKFPIQNVDAASKALNTYGKKGYEFKFATTKGAFVIVILQKEKKAAAAKPKPKKKAK